MAETTRNETVTCAICVGVFDLADVVPGAVLHGPLLEKIRAKAPEWRETSYLCLPDLHRLRHEYLAESLTTEHQELNTLQQEVLASIEQNEAIARNINDEFDDERSFGDRLADQVASFGGSWKFIIIFGIILFAWILFNTILLLTMRNTFDPYPYILLNLILSCVASIQAPVIMMSQNRQEIKDRKRAEQDFKTNLKAELEIRTLHAKIDELITHQWQRLLDIQQMQMDLMEEMGSHHAWEREQHQESLAAGDETSLGGLPNPVEQSHEKDPGR